MRLSPMFSRAKCSPFLHPHPVQTLRPGPSPPPTAKGRFAKDLLSTIRIHPTFLPPMLYRQLAQRLCTITLPRRSPATGTAIVSYLLLRLCPLFLYMLLRRQILGTAGRQVLDLARAIIALIKVKSLSPQLLGRATVHLEDESLPFPLPLRIPAPRRRRPKRGCSTFNRRVIRECQIQQVDWTT